MADVPGITVDWGDDDAPPAPPDQPDQPAAPPVSGKIFRNPKYELLKSTYDRSEPGDDLAPLPRPRITSPSAPGLSSYIPAMSSYYLPDSPAESGHFLENIYASEDSGGAPSYNDAARAWQNARNEPTWFGKAAAMAPTVAQTVLAAGALGVGKAGGKGPYERKVNDLGQYSPLDEVLATRFGSNDMVTADTLGKAGVKKSEMDVRGITPLLANGPARVSDLMTRANDNPLRMQATTFGPNAAQSQALNAYADYLQHNFPEAYSNRGKALGHAYDVSYYGARTADDIANAGDLDAAFQDYRPPKWSDQTIAHDNPLNRETVLHLPASGREGVTPSPSVQAKYGPQLEDLNNQIGALEQYRDQTISDKKQYPDQDELRQDLQRVLRLGDLQKQRDALHATMVDETIANSGGMLPHPEIGGGHYSRSGIPNVLSWMRTAPYYTEEGTPVYLLDEAQSDAAQKVRDFGARNEEKIADLRKQIQATSDQQIEAYYNAHDFLAKIDPDLGVDRSDPLPKDIVYGTYKPLQRIRSNTAPGTLLPDGTSPIEESIARMKDMRDLERRLALLNTELRVAEEPSVGHPLINTTPAWINPLLQQFIKQGVEGGNQGLAISPGEVQIKRFNRLAPVVDELWYDPEDNSLYGRKNREPVLHQRVLPKELPEWIGNENAKSLLSSPLISTDWLDTELHHLRTGNTAVGGQGQRGFYDNVLPIALGKMLKKMDPAHPGVQPHLSLYNSPEKGDEAMVIKQPWGDPFHYFPITDAVREAVKKGWSPYRFGGDVRHGYATDGVVVDPDTGSDPNGPPADTPDESGLLDQYDGGHPQAAARPASGAIFRNPEYELLKSTYDRSGPGDLAPLPRVPGLPDRPDPWGDTHMEGTSLENVSRPAGPEIPDEAAASRFWQDLRAQHYADAAQGGAGILGQTVLAGGVFGGVGNGGRKGASWLFHPEDLQRHPDRPAGTPTTVDQSFPAERLAAGYPGEPVLSHIQNADATRPATNPMPYRGREPDASSPEGDNYVARPYGDNDTARPYQAENPPTPRWPGYRAPPPNAAPDFSGVASSRTLPEALSHSVSQGIMHTARDKFGLTMMQSQAMRGLAPQDVADLMGRLDKANQYLNKVWPHGRRYPAYGMYPTSPGRGLSWFEDGYGGAGGLNVPLDFNPRDLAQTVLDKRFGRSNESAPQIPPDLQLIPGGKPPGEQHAFGGGVGGLRALLERFYGRG